MSMYTMFSPKLLKVAKSGHTPSIDGTRPDTYLTRGISPFNEWHWPRTQGSTIQRWSRPDTYLTGGITPFHEWHWPRHRALTILGWHSP
eukprot:3519622-Karenia_brevis.AAC.1